jgi:hypothetical protein
VAAIDLRPTDALKIARMAYRVKNVIEQMEVDPSRNFTPGRDGVVSQSFAALFLLSLQNNHRSSSRKVFEISADEGSGSATHHDVSQRQTNRSARWSHR